MICLTADYLTYRRKDGKEVSFMPVRLCVRCFGAIVVLLTCVVGCSDQPRVYETGGIVVFDDGAPVAQGRIEFRSLEHPISARGAIGNDGTFRMTTFAPNDGAIGGDHQVLVVQSFGANIDDMAEHRKHIGEVQRVQKRFSQYSSSGLEITIDPKADNRKRTIRLR